MSTPGIGHNSGAMNSIDDEAELEKIIRPAKAQYNMAAAEKREATGVMRDEKRDFQKNNEEVYAEINAIMESARDRMKSKLRNRPSYQEAEERKRDASVRMKAAVKLLKENGVDVAAFKQALRMADMDEVERQEYFQAINTYCSVLHLW